MDSQRIQFQNCDDVFMVESDNFCDEDNFISIQETEFITEDDYLWNIFQSKIIIFMIQTQILISAQDNLNQSMTN